ncbi:MAG: monofunctional biosynthetic peptidoglycan transglycosylase [Bacteroidetes bacterium]|nr:monofunctional biosynthetic peptidoglycan transglycosylase [Bacteroidota bacterium]
MLKKLLRIFIIFLVFTVGLVVLFRFVPVPITPLMIIRCFEQKADGQKMTLKHDWVSLKHISPKLQLAVVCSEDQHYLEHNGFDFAAIKQAVKSNKKGKKLRGASTISQQTAKNVFLWQGRNYIRKGFEVYFTFLIECLWSKERILEVYLNSIEMGNGVYGAEAAAQHWFHKEAKHLNKDEAAAIAAILPNPRKFIANPPSNYVSKRKVWIKQQMSVYGELEFDDEHGGTEAQRHREKKK